MQFSFSRPDGFKLQAGQYIDLTLMNRFRTDLWGNMRTPSIASAPFQDELLFAMLMTHTPSSPSRDDGTRARPAELGNVGVNGR